MNLHLQPLEDRFLLSYTITNIGILPGFDGCKGAALNNLGQAVGDCYNDQERTAFLYNGDLIQLGGFTEFDSSAKDINDLGDIVGWSALNDANPALLHAMLVDNGIKTDLGASMNNLTNWAEAINESGQIVGSSYFTDYPGFNPSHAVKFENGTVKDLIPAWTDTWAIDVNNKGQILVLGGPKGGGLFFNWNNNRPRPFKTLGSWDFMGLSTPADINNESFAVGASTTSMNGIWHAFISKLASIEDLGIGGQSESSGALAVNDNQDVLASMGGELYLYSNSVLTNLDDLMPPNSGWDITDAMDINNSGQILCNGYNAGRAGTFIMTPDRSLESRLTLMIGSFLCDNGCSIFGTQNPVEDNTIFVTPARDHTGDIERAPLPTYMIRVLGDTIRVMDYGSGHWIASIELAHPDAFDMVLAKVNEFERIVNI